MLKANRSTINNKNAKEKKDENELKDKYINLSLKTKLLIKNELNKASEDELSKTLNSLDDFIDIVNNFNVSCTVCCFLVRTMDFVNASTADSIYFKTSDSSIFHKSLLCLSYIVTISVLSNAHLCQYL